MTPDHGTGASPPVLSVVLPVRITGQTPWLPGRLAANLEHLAGHPGVECVVVDSASRGRHRDAIRRLCDRPRVRLVEDPAPQEPFAAGMTRNAGARAAAGGHVLFYDVDLVATPDLIPRVLAWIAAGPAAVEFLMIPCLYLTREGTERLGVDGGAADLAPYLASMLAGENRMVAHVAVSTSTVVVSRAHFLAIGGNRPEYRGHGCEDFDLLHRLASYAPLGGRPDDYHVDHKTRFPGDYRGFRAYLARYALPHLLGGLYTAHLWHPRPLERRYFRRRARNEELLARLMREHDAGIGAPPGLPPPWRDEGPPAPPIGAFVTDLLARHGYSADEHPGLLRWKNGVTAAGGGPRAKLRKLLLRPGAFLADARSPALRALGRLLSRRPRS